MLHNLGKLSGQDGFEEQVRAWMDDWSLGRLIVDTAIDMGIQDQDAWQIVATVKLLDSYQAWFDHSSGQSISTIFENWLKDSEIQRFMGVNRFKDVLWFNRESAERLAWWMFFLAVFQAGSDRERSASDVVERTIRAHAWIEKFLTAISQSEYQLEKLLALLRTPSEAPIEDASSN
jgi:hypothetical protein